MGTLTFAHSAVVPRLNVLVKLNGTPRSDVFCTGVSFGTGTQGSTAAISVPAARWDESKRRWRGSFVEVACGYDRAAMQTVFSGYVTTTTATVRGDRVELEALSLIALADKVFIGQGREGGLVARYPVRARRNGILEETGWTISSIMRDWFNASTTTWRGGGGILPQDWRNRLRLGSLDAIATATRSLVLGNLEFSQTSLKDALERILGMAKGVSMRERFIVGGSTRLEFFFIGDYLAPVREVRVARRGESAAGTNTLDMEQEDRTEDVVTRIRAFGDRRKMVISITSDHATSPLRKGWDEELEAEVLANPEGAKRGEESGVAGDVARQEFSEERGLVFRRYLLPEWLRSYVVEKANAITNHDGSEVPIQVWKYPVVLSYDEEEIKFTSTQSEVPKLLEGAQIDLEHGWIMLAKPAINMIGGNVDESGNVNDEWGSAVVGITLTVAAERLEYDTGVRRGVMDLEGLEDSGLTETVVNDSFRFVVTGAEIEGHEFLDVYALVNIDATTRQWIHPPNFPPVRDDEELLRTFAEASLRERARLATSYNITTPFWIGAYALGDRIRILGQNDFDGGTHQVMSLSYDLTNGHKTMLSTSTQIPMLSSEALKEKRA